MAIARYLFAAGAGIFCGSAFALSAQLTVLRDFGPVTGTDAQDQGAVARMKAGPGGAMYTTSPGGGQYGAGTVYKITPDGTLTVLYSFGGTPTDGVGPGAGLLLAADGTFYGTTGSDGSGSGAGTIFSITPAGAYAQLHVLGSNEGSRPGASLVQAADGVLYGVASEGGAFDTPGQGPGDGNVFKFSTGVFSVVHSFNGATGDGETPFGALVRGGDGNLYGLTLFGGQPRGIGALYRVGPDGTTKVVHSFGNCESEGYYPTGDMVLAPDGNLYGTTSSGGTHNRGTLFRFSPDGTLSTLYSFGSIEGDGDHPEHGLVLGNDGRLYGTTSQGPVAPGGMFFAFSLEGTYTVLATLGSGPPDIATPGPLAEGAPGIFYGTATHGANGTGAVFKLTVSESGTSPSTNWTASNCPVPQVAGAGVFGWALLAPLALAGIARRRAAITS